MAESGVLMAVFLGAFLAEIAKLLFHRYAKDDVVARLDDIDDAIAKLKEKIPKVKE